MNIDIEYIAVVVNSTIRMMTPVLYVALGSMICSQVFVFNVALEGQMLIGAFIAIVVNYFTGSILLSVAAAALSGMLVGFLVGVLQVKYKSSDMVVGTSINLLVQGVTTYLLFVIFHTKGAFTDSSLKGLPKVDIPVLNQIPILNTVFNNLTVLDYMAVILAFVLYFYLTRTVSGFRLRAVGINKAAVNSLGLNAETAQIGTVMFSGMLCGLGGVLLTLGQVTLYTENITAGRGFIGMAASTLGRSHPIGVIISSLFFGFAQSIGYALQGTAIKSQLTLALPYIVTVLALVFSSGKFHAKKRGLKTKI